MVFTPINPGSFPIHFLPGSPANLAGLFCHIVTKNILPFCLVYSFSFGQIDYLNDRQTGGIN